jgi:hypothetical protein|eukprot:Stramenopile-MAST_4_protein_1387
MGEENWACPTCFNKKNTCFDAFCLTCRRPAPDGTYLRKKTQAGDRFDHLLDDIMTSSDEELEEEIVTEVEPDVIVAKVVEEAKPKARVWDNPCKMCGLKDNLWELIACRVCGRAKPGHEDEVSAGPKRKPHVTSVWPDSRRIACRVTVKWSSHNGKDKKICAKNTAVFDGMGSDDQVRQIRDRVKEKWRIPVEDQVINAPSFKRRLPTDMYLDELVDIEETEWGPSYLVFLATFKKKKVSKTERAKQNQWNKVNTSVKSQYIHNEKSTVKVIQHFAVRGE